MTDLEAEKRLRSLVRNFGNCANLAHEEFDIILSSSYIKTHQSYLHYVYYNKNGEEFDDKLLLEAESEVRSATNDYVLFLERAIIAERDELRASNLADFFSESVLSRLDNEILDAQNLANSVRLGEKLDSGEYEKFISATTNAKGAVKELSLHVRSLEVLSPTHSVKSSIYSNFSQTFNLLLLLCRKIPRILLALFQFLTGEAKYLIVFFVFCVTFFLSLISPDPDVFSEDNMFVFFQAFLFSVIGSGIAWISFVIKFFRTIAFLCVGYLISIRLILPVIEIKQEQNGDFNLFIRLIQAAEESLLTDVIVGIIAIFAMVIHDRRSRRP
ncbi:MAG: hypothetical protein AAGB04_16130 [Pseudomonadota bacterium]